MCFGITVAVCGKGPARSASSKCHDFSRPRTLHRSEGGSTGKKKRLLAESLYELVSLHGRVFVCNSNNFAPSSFPLKQADVAQSQAKVSVGVLEFVLFIETALASLLVANS